MSSKTHSQEHARSYYAATAVGMRDHVALEESADCEVCVIGGGFTGLSTALNLAERGRDVVLLEANRVGWGASGRNGGQVGTGQSEHQADLESRYGAEHARMLWDLAEEAKREVRVRIEKHDIACDYKNGVVGVANTPDDADEIRENVEHLQKHYDADFIRYLEPSEVAAMFGADRDYYGGILDTQAAHIHPLNYAIGLGNAAADGGARIFERTPVKACGTRGGSHVVECANGASVRARNVVFACNGYIDGLNYRIRRLILPIHGYMIATEPLDESLRRTINRDDVAVFDSRFDLDYYRLSADGRMLWGGGESFWSELDRDGIMRVNVPSMIKRYPELKDAKVDYAWGGRLAITLNRLAAVGRLSDSVYYAQGYSGHGVALTGVAGKTIAEAICGEPDRFEAFAKVRHFPLPGNRLLDSMAYQVGTAYYRAREEVDYFFQKRRRKIAR